MAGEGRTGAPWEPRPQCETARHRLFCGRMGTAPHLLCRFDRGKAGGRDFLSRLSSYRWSWRILQRRFSPPPGGLSPTNVSRCRVFTCQGDSQSLNSDDGSGFYMAGELD